MAERTGEGSATEGWGWVRLVGGWLGKMAALLLLLYLFVCSLNLLANAFRLVGGRTASAVFRQSQVLGNPVVGLMIGVVVTALVQSSSTSSSIVVSMVAADFLDVRTAVPIVMGANIGTSLTNTLVSLGQVADRTQFERSFSGAVVHDMFNWLCVLVLLPLEWVSGYLFHLSNFVLNSHLEGEYKGVKLHLLSALTKPLTERIVKLDKSVLMGWSLGDPKYENSTLLLRLCPLDQMDPLSLRLTSELQHNTTLSGSYKTLQNSNETLGDVNVALRSATGTLGLNNGTVNNSNEDFYYSGNETYFPINELHGMMDAVVYTTCPTLTAYLPLSDAAVGVILLSASLVLLTLCLVAIVRMLSSILKGSVAGLVQRVLNADLPGVPWLTGYLAILAGAAFTFLLQSSSIFTSTLTPLVGLGVISVERVYPLTLGSNLGTTTTALLAALASDSASLRPAIQIALVHLFFNITGLLMWYPIPFMRLPIRLALALGKVTAEYRWFAVVYILLTFCIVPLFVFSVSLGGAVAMYSVFIPISLVLVFVVVVNTLQNKCPSVLPSFLQTWLWLPLPLRSLKPYDNVLSHLMCCVKNREDKNNLYTFVTPAESAEITTKLSEQVVVVVEEETTCKNGCCGNCGVDGGSSGTNGAFHDTEGGGGIDVGKIGGKYSKTSNYRNDGACGKDVKSCGSHVGTEVDQIIDFISTDDHKADVTNGNSCKGGSCGSIGGRDSSSHGGLDSNEEIQVHISTPQQIVQHVSST